MEETTAKLIEELREGGMHKHPVIKFLINRYHATGESTALVEFLERNPHILRINQNNRDFTAHQKALNPFKPYPTRAEARKYLTGPLKFGFVNEFDDMFGVPFSVLNKILLIIGRPESGKSVLAKYLLLQLLSKPRPFSVIIPDLKKEYRHLAAYCPSLKIITKEQLMLNPLEVPPWAHPKDHARDFAKTFVSENYLVGTSENEIRKLVVFLYRRKGVFDNSRDYPTLQDLYDLVVYRATKTRSYKFGDILLWIENRLSPYTLVDNFHCQRGIPFDTWKDTNVVIEMDEVFSDRMYNFTVATVINQLYVNYKKHNLTGTVRNLFVVDEARILFQAHRDTSTFGESMVNELITKTRAFGIGFLVLSQESSSINQTLRSLSFIKATFPLQDGSDLTFIQQSFGLNDEQREHIFKLPAQTQCIIRYGGFDKPFLLQVPPVRLKRQLTEEQVQEKMGPFRAELAQHVIKPPQSLRSEPKPDLILPEGTSTDIPAQAAALLLHLSKQPFTTVGNLDKVPGFTSPAQVAKALEWLRENGFVTLEQYRVSQGKKSHFSVLEEKALAYLHLKNPLIKGKGQFEHKLYQSLIHGKLSSEGIQATIEGRINDSRKLIDVLSYSKEEGYTAWEVTLHFDNIDSNCKDIDAGAKRVILVTRDKEDLLKAQKLVEQDATLARYRDWLSFSTIDEFFLTKP